MLCVLFLCCEICFCVVGFVSVLQDLFFAVGFVFLLPLRFVFVLCVLFLLSNNSYLQLDCCYEK